MVVAAVASGVTMKVVMVAVFDFVSLRASPRDSSFLSPHVEISATFYLFFQIHSPVDSLFFLYSI